MEDRSKPVDLDSSTPRRWASFAILLTGAFLSSLDFSINAALPQIRIDLASTSSELQLVVSVYIATYATLLVTGGRLGDIYGASDCERMRRFRFCTPHLWSRPVFDGVCRWENPARGGGSV